ncbi:MAG: hypothetical protein K6F79_06220 [Saccharofermentans sp.]|nr:hypothetical protein [Saccharofermentans sp.]
MINGNINSFLDTGWYTESTLFFNGNVYWCEATTENGLTTFFVNRWKASLTDNMYYNSHIDANGDPVDFRNILILKDNDMDIIKKNFLCSNIFDGKTFWEVEQELVWVDEGSPIVEE